MATPVFIVATAAVRPRMHGLSVEMSMTNCKNKNIIKRTLFTHMQWLVQDFLS